MSPAIWRNYWQQFEGQLVENTFRLTRMLGMGGFGTVFEADHVVEERVLRRVAVKLIPAEPTSMQRQLDELTTATLFQHPHILRCFHAGSTSIGGMKLLFLAMEVAEESLQARLQRGVLTPVDAAKMASDIASALEYVHQQNLVHRDLKSANVLRVNEHWKLADFGTVRRSPGTATDHTKSVIGTAGYMPPESFEGTVSPAWDLWSLGVLILESLTGNRPFRETSEHELIGAIIQKAPSIPAGLPEPFREIAHACLEKNYRQRCTARDVLNALKRSRTLKVAALIEQAQAHRDARRWDDAMKYLNEAYSLDDKSADIGRLIDEVQKQREQEELERRVRELRAQAEDAMASSDLDGALERWREILRLTPGDPDIEKAITEILDEKRVQSIKRDLAESIGRNDFESAAQLINKLRHPTPPPNRDVSSNAPAPGVPLPPMPASSISPRAGCGLLLMVMAVGVVILFILGILLLLFRVQ